MSWTLKKAIERSTDRHYHKINMHLHTGLSHTQTDNPAVLITRISFFPSVHIAWIGSVK